MTELHDRQIASMRHAVMSEVQADQRRRTIRLRTGVVAMGAVVAMGGLGASLLNFDNSRDRDIVAGASMSDGDFEAGGPGPSTIEIDRESFESQSGDSAAAPDRAANRDLSQVPAEESQGSEERQVITVGSVRINVHHPRSSAGEVSEWAVGLGGYVESRQEFDGDNRRASSATVVVRIPASKVDAAIAELDQFGEVLQTEITNSDVTTELIDLDARIDSLRDSVERLRELMRDATTTSDLLDAERLVTDRQAQLDSLLSQHTYLSSQVAMSELRIILTAQDEAETPSTDGFKGGLLTGWNSLVSTVNAIFQGVGVALPWLGVFLAFTIAIWILVKLVRLAGRVRK